MDLEGYRDEYSDEWDIDGESYNGETYDYDKYMVVHICPECGRPFRRKDMEFSHDCQGIPFRLLCFDCLNQIEDERGFDGELYTEDDECIDYDY